MQLKRFYKFCYAAIKRHGDRHWSACSGVIEINPNYTVCCSSVEKGGISGDTDYAYIVELSNGTKFLLFLRGYGHCRVEALLCEDAEDANVASDHQRNCERVRQRIHILNNGAL